MYKKRLMSILMVLVALSLVLAACKPAATPTEAPAPTKVEVKQPEPTEVPPEPTEVPPEPTEVVTEEAPKPSVDPSGQTISFWHVWGQGLPNETMTAVVDEFNQTNEYGITVEAIDQGRYGDLEDAFNAAIQSGDLPDIVVGYTNALANWYSVDAIVDLEPLINDPFYGLTDEDKAAFFEGALNGGVNAGGTTIGFPISQSENVLFYNSGWAKELGFDNPPTTPEEFKAQACAAAEANNNDDDPDNDSTGGLVLYPGASNIMSWIFAFGGDIVNEDGSGYDFTNQSVVDVATFLKDLWDNGCAFQTESYPNPEFASRKALYTMSSTAGLPYQVSAFEAEDAIKDEWTLIPFPGPNGNKAVDLYGQYVAVVNTNPERMMASWLFIKYFTSPEAQAKWIQGSAYYPTRTDTIPLLDSYSKENPIWSNALSYLDYGKAEPAWPSWSSVRRSVGDTFQAILQGTPEDIPTLLDELNTAAAEAVAETQ
ncbi:MAG: extracellular solute-binding protein [Anaerolineales bacterium]|nr:extracellular solute-binding protein [Anaerolineales bacterium]